MAAGMKRRGQGLVPVGRQSQQGLVHGVDAEVREREVRMTPGSQLAPLMDDGGTVSWWEPREGA